MTENAQLVAMLTQAENEELKKAVQELEEENRRLRKQIGKYLAKFRELKRAEKEERLDSSDTDSEG